MAGLAARNFGHSRGISFRVLTTCVIVAAANRGGDGRQDESRRLVPPRVVRS